jgi:hypothetical protein
MKRPDLFTLMKDRAPSAEFFVQSPFRSRIFPATTAAWAFVVVNIALVAVHSLRSQNLISLFFSALATIALVATWWGVFRIHKSIRRLFEDGQIEKLEKGSALDKVLHESSALIQSGFFYAFLGFGLGLVATLILYAPLHY